MKFRKPLKITSRTSSVTNGFVQAIIPSEEPTDDARAEALRVLGMDEESIRCVYCGGNATDWDHLRPLVSGKRPTGYFNEIRNLVPACGPCNQSKSGQEWRRWMAGLAKGSPGSRGVTDIEERIAVLERYETWGEIEKVELEALVGSDLWKSYWDRLAAIESLMFEAQAEAIVIRERIIAARR
ncbi:HNH endonuclease [Sphingomonas bacterium]|uniref:HNH endonuclease n=1 Tax=Sphingomonas bacterium TaxID=1895847 RepID=UPI002638C208|nr:HNH endonuclease [Sphingomonas bacterium]